MPQKGETSPQLGAGLRSRVPLPSHPFKGHGMYWRNEKDFIAFKKKRAKERKVKVPKKRIGYGVSCQQRTAEHRIKRAGRWWKSEEDYKRFYRETELAKKAAAAGLSLDEYVETKRKATEARQSSTNRSKYLKAELNRLREKHGLPKASNRTHLEHVYIVTRDEEVRNFLLLHSAATLTADEKIARIRKLFLSGEKPLEILYQTAIVCGINMRKTS